MKTNALGNTTRLVGKMFFALALLLVAVVVGFGGTALFVYHQFGDIRRPAQLTHSLAADRRATEPNPPFRQVANIPADQSTYTYADNNGGQPTSPANRVHSADAVPAALDPSSREDDFSNVPGQLSDPESHYIVDDQTGRVVGIDGSAGARRDAEQERLQQLSEPPRAVAVQTPPPEVRVASPVLDNGMPVYHGTAVAPASVAGSQYMPVRKALPVAPAEVDSATGSFNAGEYMRNDEDRPVLRAQAVVPAGAQVVRTVRVYRLPDGTQTVAAD